MSQARIHEDIDVYAIFARGQVMPRAFRWGGAHVHDRSGQPALVRTQWWHAFAVFCRHRGRQCLQAMFQYTGVPLDAGRSVCLKLFVCAPLREAPLPNLVINVAGTSCFGSILWRRMLV